MHSRPFEPAHVSRGRAGAASTGTNFDGPDAPALKKLLLRAAPKSVVAPPSHRLHQRAVLKHFVRLEVERAAGGEPPRAQQRVHLKLVVVQLLRQQNFTIGIVQFGRRVLAKVLQKHTAGR